MTTKTTTPKPRAKHLQLGYEVIWERDHPLADSRGRVLVHRKVMFDLVGPEPQPCFWCGIVLPWRTGRKVKGLLGIEVDHLDNDRTNNHPSNLVTTCTGCNTRKSQQGHHVHRAIEVAK